MPFPSLEHFKNTFLAIVVLAGGAGWLYVLYNDHRSKEPVEVVKKHFVFYPEFSHGVWREAGCPAGEKQKCREVSYTVPLKGCGTVNFGWRVFPQEDADATWSYTGPNPRIDENKYPLYAVLNEDSRLIDSPAVGLPIPDTCQLK